MTVQIRLVEVTDDNRDAVMAVRVRPDQERFVASVEKSFEHAAQHPGANPWFRAVYDGDDAVGFVMLSWNVTPQPGIRGPYFLWRLLVGADVQGRGYGSAILNEVVALVRAAGATELFTSCVPGEGSPEPFYRGYGFVPTGEIDEDGETVLALDLSTRP
ncbi:GNAT family N-acetyltransferase [Lentzea sp. BCCO 10_0856]|uniref:GNAT family N-acetyltransferase n=1 Tax=Lentzea miocenica TaxID=3095431 RepID=A0ABU4TE52_9PSEU|nr:GNAT family N-acetyltransferase [Lentzea sp. BCCO 10_0856]MDX8036446.1 GNAT family N-acetyltransferase [Lentzea sp. BCCO 10_0856]